MPKKDWRAATRLTSRCAFQAAARSGSVGPLCAGTLKLGVRWITKRRSACLAISVTAWIPEEPVPMTATRLPVKSTGSSGHRAV